MARNRSLHLLTILWAGLLSSAPAKAESMSCGNRLVSTGDSAYEVRSICGEPDAANHRVEYRSFPVNGTCSRNGDTLVCGPVVAHTVAVVIDEWTYDFGRNHFMRHLTFEQGRLDRIDTGSYGHERPQ